MIAARPPGLWSRLAALMDPPGPPPPASHPAAGPESSLRLRLAVLANTLVAFVAYAAVDPDMQVLPPMLAVCAGMVFSHWRRTHRNLLLKWLLAAGMLYALWQALGNLVRGTIDPRLSLAQLLFWLQVLNSFDLPRRRNLRVAVLVAAVLMVVTGTLSRTTDYGALLLAYGLTLGWANYEAFAAETGARPAPPGRTALVTTAMLMAVLIVATPLFLISPRKERTLTGASLPLSINIPLPPSLDARVRAASAPSGGAGTADGSNGRAVFGTFDEQLDLNTRGAPSEEVVLRVQTDQPQYWRAIAYDHYDGRIWSMSRPNDVKAYNVAMPPMRIGRPEGQAAGQMITQTVYIERDQANLVFSAWTPTAVYFPTGLIWRDAYDSLRSPVTLQKDMYYSVISEVPQLNRRTLARARNRAIPPHLKPYLELPALTPRVVARFKQAAAEATTPYNKMAALQIHLSEAFPYDLNVPPVPQGRESVDYFLFEQKAGFCQQFATALAVAGRVNGVPTRLVAGFAPGDYNPFTGLYEVKGKHAHAWIEAWIPSVGWVQFDATPASWVPDFAQAGNPGGSTMIAAVFNYLRPHLERYGPGLAALSLLLGAVTAPWWWRALRGEPVAPATRAYRRLRRRLARMGVPDEATAAPREWLAGAAADPRLAQALPELTAFVSRYEAARFGGDRDEPALLATARRAEEALSSKGM